MTYIKSTDPKELAKWRKNAEKSAKAFKAGKATYPNGVCVAGFFFDDAVIKLPVKKSDVETMTYAELVEHIYQGVITMAQTGGSA